MTDRKKLTTRRGDSPAPQRPDVERAVREVSRDGPPKKRIPFEVPPETHRKLAGMRANSRDNIPVREFLSEAVDDLFEKYRNGDGRYKVSDIKRILGE